MLLHSLRRRVRRDDPERGTALATVLGILVATAVLASTLLATSVYATGFSSATRASVQAQAAAEAGIDFARANLGSCSGGTIPRDQTLVPRFEVTVSHRSAIGAAWTESSCPPRGVVEVRLVSRGFAEHIGAAGHTRGDSRRMEAVLRTQLPRAVVGDLRMSVSGTLKLPAVAGRPSDISTNGNFSCSGGLDHTGTLYVGGTYTRTTNCLAGTVVTGTGFDPTMPPNVFPRVLKNDVRWPKTAMSLRAVANAFGSPTTTDACTVQSDRSVTVTLSTVPVVIDATGCPDGYTLSVDATLVLMSDVVIFAERLDLPANKTLYVKSGDGLAHSLHFVKPWPANREKEGCATMDANLTTGARLPAKIRIMGVLKGQDTTAGILMYSSTDIEGGPNSSKEFTGQMYGCTLSLQGSASVRFRPMGPMTLVSKRDLAG